MLEIHRLRHLDWIPSAVIALATSPDGAAIAAARDSGAIEVWKAAPGSVGWYCQLTIPGMQGAAISCLEWCSSSVSRQGRLFSSGLDGFITEWDLERLEAKAQTDSFGGSVWQVAAQPSSQDDDSRDIAAACDDGSVRLFTLNDSMTYKKAFPRVKGRVLSVAWSLDGKRVYAGGSDGCIRSWDAATCIELYRITAGIGGQKKLEELCVWSLLVLRSGTLVSGDSTGTTQFWDERGMLLEALTRHDADVLALAAAPSHTAVFAAGADGQVVMYQLVHESSRRGNSDLKEDASVGFGDKWTYVGTKRCHSHDVRALTVAIPVPIDAGDPTSKPWTRPTRERNKWPEPDHRKWARPGIPMLVSGGNDAKLFAYPANDMMSYQPHDICPAPERPVVQLAPGLAQDGNVVMMAQHPTYIDIWRVASSQSTGKRPEAENGVDSDDITLGKRKRSDSTSEETLSTSYQQDQASKGAQSGQRPVLLAKIKSKATAHITCSAFSEDGKYVAFSDRTKARLFELKHAQKQWTIKKKNLPGTVPPAHRMIFSVGSSRLIMACSQGEILVLDTDNLEVLHVFKLAADDLQSPVALLCASPDGQWLAAGSSSGNLVILNLETLRHHWSVPLFDGTPATAAVFHPGNNAVLIVTTAANKIHVLDIAARELGRWSKENHASIPSEILEFPGGISGLTVSPSTGSTEIIAYSPRAMCLIDFSKPVAKNAVIANGNGNGAPHHHHMGNGHANGVHHHHHRKNKNFVLTPFKNPVLFVGYVAKSSLLIVERPWLEVLNHFQAPVYRHRYGT
ncbi:WD repeat-containing protein PCN isoform X1 [Selaginella moellendorffii]|uniref:WD repeat-containing protein PCN isoform X1 n=1 Tax=Selaginella moellendorffii TaxID=88036 RepID=UPI000D1C6294|nr:WD repeat-containing protein PCN isoform X1 [Selaginella moellendorffii]|eukprot:XP_024544921.1 WD repeat-containing protein PCN isoform X1 [Selaginella moellendorffii]